MIQLTISRSNWAVRKRGRALSAILSAILIAFACAATKSQVSAVDPSALQPSTLATLARKIPGGAAPIIVLPESQIVPAETAELENIYNQTIDRLAKAPAKTEGAPDRVAALHDFRNNLATFATVHSNSAYAPGVCLRVAQMARLRLSYSQAIDFAQRAYFGTRDLKDPNARGIIKEAASELATLLVNTGRHDDLIALEKDAASLGISAIGPEWSRAVQRRLLLAAVPEDAFKCGIYCTVLLGREVQPNEGDIDGIRETATSPRGLTATEVVQIARSHGIWIQAIKVKDFTTLPTPCILHLNTEHYVYVASRFQGFFRVVDSATTDSLRIVDAAELAEDASGVAIVPDTLLAGQNILSAFEAGKVRGKCHLPNPDVDEDQPAPPSLDPCDVGMGRVGVNMPYLNSWSTDAPLQAADGTAGRGFLPAMSANPLQNDGPAHPTFFSFVAADTRLAMRSAIGVDAAGFLHYVFLPYGGKLVADFSSGDTIVSDYRGHRKIQRSDTGVGFYSRIVVTESDGAYRRYGRPGVNFSYRLEAEGTPGGLETVYTYDSIVTKLLSVTTPGGIIYSVNYNGYLIASINGSDGKVVTYGYGERIAVFPNNGVFGRITSATDGRGIRTEFNYYDGPNAIDDGRQVVTPYGTTTAETTVYPSSATSPMIAKMTIVTYPDGKKEAWAQLREFAPYPALPSNYVPALNSAISQNSFDYNEIGSRNTVHWTPSQFEPIAGTAIYNYGWAQFARGETRHWLSRLDANGNSHFDTLSWVMAPSQSGNTGEMPDITWYDYPGKRIVGGSYVRTEVGTDVLPSAIAKVMPDGSVWYKTFTRNTVGNVTSETENWTDGGPLYRTTQRQFDSTGRYMTQLTQPNVGTQRFEYQNNRLFREITSLNEANEFLYDIFDRVTDAKYFTGRRVTSSYTPISASGVTNGWIRNDTEYFGTTVNATSSATREWNISLTWTNLDGTVVTLPTTRTISTDARGLVVTRFNDALDRLIEERTPTATNRWWHEALTTYPNSTGQRLILGVTKAATPVGSIQTAYDSRRRPTDITDQLGLITHFDYCTCGSPSHVQEPISPSVFQHTYYAYDNQGKRYLVTYTDATTLSTTFDAVGRPIIYQDYFGYTTNTLDNLGRIKQVRNANGLVSAFAYNSADMVTQKTDSAGVVASLTFDSNGRMTSSRTSVGTNGYGYTLYVSGPTSTTNAVGNVVQFAYDAAGRKTNEVQVGISTTSYAYSAAGDLRYLFDGNGNRTEWKYDTFGRVIEKWYQGQTTADLVYTYDLIGHVTNRFSRTATGSGTTGLNTGYSYDARNLLSGIQYQSSPAVTFGYDGLRRLTSDTVSGGIANTYSYAARGGLATETASGWASSQLMLGYTAGLRTSLNLKQPGLADWTTTYQYDAGRRLTNISVSSSNFVYLYSPAAGVSGSTSTLISSIILPVTSGSAQITNQYDSAGRMLNTLLKVNGSMVNQHLYSYNAASQPTQQTRSDSSYVNYAYDAAGELQTALTYASGGASIFLENRGYAYDSAMNMIRRTNNTATTTYSVNALNQVTSGAATYSYDRPGNRTSSSLNETWNYDGENRLIEYIYGGTPNVRTTFAYDARSRLRIRQEYTLVNSIWTLVSEIRYLYDGMRVIQERDASNVPKVTYSRGLDLTRSWEGAGGIGGLLGRTAHSGAGGALYAHAFYHADRGGNVICLLNPDGSQGATYRYDGFGNLISSGGLLAGANAYRFSSKEWCGTAGLYYYGFRFYDPLSQRWLNRDPIAERGGIGLYGFLSNNSIGFVDSYGLWSIGAWLYTGDGDAPEDVYDGALDAAADWIGMMGVTEAKKHMSGGYILIDLDCIVISPCFSHV